MTPMAVAMAQTPNQQLGPTTTQFHQCLLVSAVKKRTPTVRSLLKAPNLLSLNWLTDETKSIDLVKKMTPPQQALFWLAHQFCCLNQQGNLIWLFQEFPDTELMFRVLIKLSILNERFVPMLTIMHRGYTLDNGDIWLIASRPFKICNALHMTKHLTPKLIREIYIEATDKENRELCDWLYTRFEQDVKDPKLTA